MRPGGLALASLLVLLGVTGIGCADRGGDDFIGVWRGGPPIGDDDGSDDDGGDDDGGDDDGGDDDASDDDGGDDDTGDDDGGDDDTSCRDYGFSVDQTLELTSGSLVDSFDSTLGPYGGNNQGAAASVTTNSTGSCSIDLSGSDVEGDAYVGVGGNPGSAICTSSGGSVSGNELALSSPVPIHGPSPPSLPGSEGSETVSGGQETWTQDRHFDNLTIENGAVVTVDGDIAVGCDGNAEILGAALQLAPGARLALYVSGNCVLSGGAAINTDLADPARVVIVMESSGSFELGQGVQLYGTVVHEHGDLLVDDGDLYGAARGQYATVTSGGLHVDERLICP